MQENNKKVIIVFPDHWLSYSPTVINISRLLNQCISVVIITTGKAAYLPGTFSINEKIAVEFIDNKSKRVLRFVRKIDSGLISFFSFFLRIRIFNKVWLRELLIGYNIENLINYRRFRKRVRAIYKEGDTLIGVDNIGILCVTRSKKAAYAVSLEIGKNIFYYFIKWRFVKSLIIQTEERKDYFLPVKHSSLPTYLVQNAPVVSPSLFNKTKENNFKIIYLGNLAIEYNALDKIADSLKYLPECYKMVYKGPYNERTRCYFQKNYTAFYDSGRLAIDNEYVENDALPDYLKSFAFGIALYDISTLPYNNFNVISCPSGKLFNYYNSGIPVVGNDIIGLKSIKDFKAGRLIDELDGKTLANAIIEIANDYSEYSFNSKKAAVHFDFERNINLFFSKELAINNCFIEE